MERCQWCGKDSSGYGIAVLTIKEDEPSQSICEDCYNRYMADMLGVEDYKDFEEDSNDALRRLYKKIRKGLSQKFIKREVFQGHELISFKDNLVEGRIEWDDRYDDRTPKFIIDGQEYSLEEIGRMMMSCEGWNFKLEIIEPTE